MKLKIKITDKLCLKSDINHTEFYISMQGQTLKEVMPQITDFLLGTNDENLDQNRLLDSFLFILNGTKVIGKDEYSTLRLNEGDTIIIAPLVAGG